MTEDFDTYASTILADDLDALTRRFAGIDCVLLDFDGPVCAVYSGHSSASIAADMRAALRSAGFALTAATDASDDPLEVLAEAAQISTLGQELGEELLSAHELRAIATSSATPGAGDFLEACASSGLRVVIVSNNGERAIQAYLETHQLSDLVMAVIGRDPHNAGLMKPSPYLLHRALATGPFASRRSVMLGDSLTDIDAARAAGLSVVALANKREKLVPFQAAAPDELITDMVVAAAAIRAARDS